MFELSRGEEMVVGKDAAKILELSGEEREVKLLFGEDATKLGEVGTKLLELLEGEMTKTVEGEPVESAPGVKLPIEHPLIMDWPPPRVALVTSAS